MRVAAAGAGVAPGPSMRRSHAMSCGLYDHCDGYQFSTRCDAPATEVNDQRGRRSRRHRRPECRTCQHDCLERIVASRGSSHEIPAGIFTEQRDPFGVDGELACMASDERNRGLHIGDCNVAGSGIERVVDRYPLVSGRGERLQQLTDEADTAARAISPVHDNDGWMPSATRLPIGVESQRGGCATPLGDPVDDVALCAGDQVVAVGRTRCEWEALSSAAVLWCRSAAVRQCYCAEREQHCDAHWWLHRSRRLHASTTAPQHRED